MLARLRVPVLVALLVALASHSTPVQLFSRSHGLRMCEIHCTIVIFPADMRVSSYIPVGDPISRGTFRPVQVYEVFFDLSSDVLLT